MKHFSGKAGLMLAVLAPCSCAAIAANDQPPRPEPGTLLIVAGTGEKGFSGDGGPATQAKLRFPFDVAVDSAGNRWPCESHGGIHRAIS